LDFVSFYAYVIEFYVSKTLEVGGTINSYVNKFDNKYIGSQNI